MEGIVELFPESHRKSSSKSVVLFFVLAVLIGLAVMAIAFYGLGPMLAKPVSPLTPKQQDVAQVLGLDAADQSNPKGLAALPHDQLENLLRAIQSQIELPQENTVQAYQITDISAFAGNEFFSKATNQDILIIFQPSTQVVLYSSLQQRVIAQGQLQ